MKKRGKKKSINFFKKDKKGISVLISWVLMVGFVVGLAAMVTMWSTGFIGNLTEQQLSQKEKDIHCQSIKIAVGCTYDQSGVTVKIKNKGNFNVHGARIRFKLSGGTSKDEEVVDLLRVNTEITRSFSMTNTETIEIFPKGKIDEDSESFYCPKVPADCKPV
jgi:FlaG/FlaF family flagellin (archaellin)